MTSIEFLKEKLTSVFVNDKGFNKLFEQAKEMHKQEIEISDEEIEEEIRNRYMTPIADYAWRDACKWYREQLKQL